MDALIDINYDRCNPAVSARKLHEHFKLTERFSTWFKKQVGYGFEEGIDFEKFTFHNEKAHQDMEDAWLSLDMAKQVCMLQRNDMGRKIRQYFIDVEKAWNDPKAVMARELETSDKKIRELTEQIESYKPKLLIAEAMEAEGLELNLRTFAGVITEKGKEKEPGFSMGSVKLFAWMRDNGYLCKDGSNKNYPTQKYMDRGYFTVRLDDESERPRVVTFVTPRGQQYFLHTILARELSIVNNS